MAGLLDDRVGAPAGRDLLRDYVPVLAGGAVVVAAVTDPGDALSVAALVVAVAVVAVWAVRPRTPVAVVVVTVVGLVVLAKAPEHLDGALFLVCLLAVVVTGWESSRPVLVATVPLLLATPLLVNVVNAGDVDVGTWVFAVLFAGLSGWLFRRQEALNAQLQDARRELERRVEAEERRRIARDVHDAVGHGLAAVLLQVASARHVLRRDVEEADAALAAAQEAGRRSLGELRGSVGALRGERQVPGLVEQSVEGIEQLVEEARAGGLDLEVTTVGDPAGVDPAVGRAVYRIAQEALANAAHHAPWARTVVHTSFQEGCVQLRVHSIGGVRPSAGPGVGDRRPGFGLVGMHERARVAGGVLSARVVPDGWLVQFDVPAGTGRRTTRSAP